MNTEKVILKCYLFKEQFIWMSIYFWKVLSLSSVLYSVLHSAIQSKWNCLKDFIFCTLYFIFLYFFFLLNMLFQEDTKALLCICINIIADLDLFSCTVKKKEPKTLALISQILNIDALKYLWIMILLLFITVFFKTVL